MPLREGWSWIDLVSITERYSLIGWLNRACDIGVFNNSTSPKKCYRKKDTSELECDLDISHLVKTGETKHRDDIEWLFKTQNSIIEEDKKESVKSKKEDPGNSFRIDLQDNVNLPTNINRKNTVVIQKKSDADKINKVIQSNRTLSKDKLDDDYDVEFGDNISDEDSFIIVNRVKNIFNTNNSQVHTIAKLSIKKEEEREESKEQQNTSEEEQEVEEETENEIKEEAKKSPHPSEIIEFWFDNFKIESSLISKVFSPGMYFIISFFAGFVC